MNQAMIVRTEASAYGVRHKLWVDDENGNHVAVAMLEVPREWLRLWLMDIAVEEDHADQQQLTFED